MPIPDSDGHAEEIVADPFGPVVTSLLMRLALRSGRPVAPRVTSQGTLLPLAPKVLGGRGELCVTTVESGGTRVALAGTPPPWPLRRGWARRTLRRLLH